MWVFKIYGLAYAYLSSLAFCFPSLTSCRDLVKRKILQREHLGQRTFSTQINAPSGDLSLLSLSDSAVSHHHWSARLLIILPNLCMKFYFRVIDVKGGREETAVVWDAQEGVPEPICKNVFINLGSEQQILLTYTFVGILFATLYDFKSTSRMLLYQCFPLNIEVPSPLGRFRWTLLFPTGLQKQEKMVRWDCQWWVGFCGPGRNLGFGADIDSLLLSWCVLSIFWKRNQSCIVSFFNISARNAYSHCRHHEFVMLRWAEGFGAFIWPHWLTVTLLAQCSPG